MTNRQEKARERVRYRHAPNPIPYHILLSKPASICRNSRLERIAALFIRRFYQTGRFNKTSKPLISTWMELDCSTSQTAIIDNAIVIKGFLINHFLVIPAKVGQIRRSGFEQLQLARRIQARGDLRNPAKSMPRVPVFAGVTNKSDTPSNKRIKLKVQNA
ncbi:MAG: hypothetical protein J5I81_12305 [Nitrococcus mobilis]|nr:hypothetical protein [Nitrococcus mobilis]